MLINKYSEIVDILDSVREAYTFIDGNELSDEEAADLTESIGETVVAVNISVFGYSQLAEYTLKGDCIASKSEFTDSLLKWIELIESVISKRLSLQNDFDEQFCSIMDVSCFVAYDDVFHSVISKLVARDEKYKFYLNRYYQSFSHMWGSLDIDNGVYDVVKNRLDVLYEHNNDFIWLYEHLEDYRSKLVLINYLKYWLEYDHNLTSTMICEYAFKDYFDLDLLTVKDDEVVVELGAFDGETVLDYIKTFHRYKDIYCFEVSEANICAIEKNLDGYPNIHVINKAAGSGQGTIKMQISGRVDSANHAGTDMSSEETVDVAVSTVDAEVNEPVDMIIMDIEGAEKEALEGCRKHITGEHPKLLISVYHNNVDIWKVAEMIYEMDPGYRFYLRSNGRQWGPAEIILFAL